MAKGNIKTKGHLAGTNPQEDIDKLKQTTIPTQMQGSPFKLGSNRGNTSYSGFQAKGLITPIQNKEGEEEMKQGYRGKSDSQKAKELKKEKQQAKKAAELTYTTRYHEWLKENPKGTKKQYNNTEEGKELAMDVSARESETQNY
jgi:hypothetical protein